jgi:nitroreductase
MTILNTGLPTEVAHRIIEFACLAPSFHNTQPWRWHTTGDEIELHADPSRRLLVEDPDGRNMVISGGAALHHAQVAARALGWEPVMERLPDGPEATLLARIRLDPRHRKTSSLADLETLRTRRTDRRRFSSWPVPEERLVHLAAAAAEWGTYAVPVIEVADRYQVELLVSQAFTRQVSDAAVAVEQHDWVDRGHLDGVPSQVVPANHSPFDGQASRFGRGRLDEPDRDVESSDGLILLGSASDDADAWLRVGEGLSALWLSATRDGLSVVPLSQVIEVPQTRAALQQEVLKGLIVPHLLVRIGWQATSRSDLAPTPRRPLDDVLRP